MNPTKRFRPVAAKPERNRRTRMLEPSWNSAVLRPDEILVVHYSDPENQPDSVTLANAAANMPDHLRGRVIFMVGSVELEVIAREQRPLLIKQLKDLVARLEQLE